MRQVLMMLLNCGPDIDSSRSITSRSISLIQAIVLLQVRNNVFYMHAANGEWLDKPTLVEYHLFLMNWNGNEFIMIFQNYFRKSRIIRWWQNIHQIQTWFHKLSNNMVIVWACSDYVTAILADNLSRVHYPCLCST